MPELTNAEFDALVGVKAVLVDVTGTGRMDTAPYTIARQKYRCSGSSSDWPDEVVAEIVRWEILNPSIALIRSVETAPGEHNLFGVPYDALAPGDLRAANISVTGPGSALGMILREMLRRMEGAFAADARHIERLGPTLQEMPT